MKNLVFLSLFLVTGCHAQDISEGKYIAHSFNRPAEGKADFSFSLNGDNLVLHIHSTKYYQVFPMTKNGYCTTTPSIDGSTNELDCMNISDLNNIIEWRSSGKIPNWNDPNNSIYYVKVN